MQRNQFLRLFLCEREIIVNALFLLKCLGKAEANSKRKGTNKLAIYKMFLVLFCVFNTEKKMESKT